MYMNNENVELEIRNQDVSHYVSYVSKYPLIRKKIVSLQQEMGLSKGIVMEGRDIGSVVFPSAELKLFITASLEVRAERRYQESSRSRWWKYTLYRWITYSSWGW